MDRAWIDAAWRKLQRLTPEDTTQPGHVYLLATLLLDLSARLEALEQVERDRQTQIAEDSWYDRGSEDS
jgi:hypothetical protein